MTEDDPYYDDGDPYLDPYQEGLYSGTDSEPPYRDSRPSSSYDRYYNYDG